MIGQGRALAAGLALALASAVAPAARATATDGVPEPHAKIPACAPSNLELAPSSDNEKDPKGRPITPTPDAGGAWNPVLLIHGFNSGKDAFSSLIDLSANAKKTVKVGRSLVGQLRMIPGAAVYTFDYQADSAKWVTNQGIGAQLGEAIDCLNSAYGRKVIVVTHSMGGLATRWSLAQPGNGGASRAGEVSTVVNFGTPNTGSDIAAIAEPLMGGAAAAGATLGQPVVTAAAVFFRLLLAACGRSATTDATRQSEECKKLLFLSAWDSDAGKALRTGSGELAKLPAWPAGVPVTSLAGSMLLSNVQSFTWFGLPLFSTEQSANVGDVVVSLKSANSSATHARDVRCKYKFLGVNRETGLPVLGGPLILLPFVSSEAGQIPSSPCFHNNLMRTIELTNAAIATVADEIAAAHHRSC